MTKEEYENKYWNIIDSIEEQMSHVYGVFLNKQLDELHELFEKLVKEI